MRSSTVPQDGRGGRSSGGGGDSAPPVDGAAPPLAGLGQKLKPPQPDEAPHDRRPGRWRQSLASMTGTLGGVAGGRADQARGRRPGAAAEPASTHSRSTAAASNERCIGGSGEPPSPASKASVAWHRVGLSHSGGGGLWGGGTGGAGGGPDLLHTSRQGRDDGRGDTPWPWRRQVAKPPLRRLAGETPSRGRTGTAAAEGRCPAGGEGWERGGVGEQACAILSTEDVTTGGTTAAACARTRTSVTIRAL